mmetsp:Transcript_76684/g.127778  ORF Transcript_76684/g.127778 Transcript_76684/m.127778 type:complete len:134 (-) Transcript_76684:371-772(-)
MHEKDADKNLTGVPVPLQEAEVPPRRTTHGSQTARKRPGGRQYWAPHAWRVVCGAGGCGGAAAHPGCLTFFLACNACAWSKVNRYTRMFRAVFTGQTGWVAHAKHKRLDRPETRLPEFPKQKSYHQRWEFRKL